MTQTKSILTHYLYTDEIAEIFRKFGLKIVCISYGFQNLHDLIVYEV